MGLIYDILYYLPAACRWAFMDSNIGWKGAQKALQDKKHYKLVTYTNGQRTVEKYDQSGQKIERFPWE